MRRLSGPEVDLLHTLHALRYVTTDQIRQHCMGARSLSACQTRLSRLHKDGILERTLVPHPKWRVAWSLGANGLREVRRLGNGVYEPTKPLSVAFIPHLLATNHIYFVLAGSPPEEPQGSQAVPPRP